MLYGTAKRREMARSLLPSTARKTSAARLAGIRRRARRNTRQQLRSLITPGGPGTVGDAYDTPVDLRAWPQREIRDAVWERRLYDKVAPFQRWAVATTRHLPAESRLHAVWAIVPHNLIGRHALSHVDHLEHFKGHLPERERYTTRKASRPSADQLRTEVRRVLAAGELGAFNAHMKSYPCLVDGEHWHRNPCRTLAGAHDVDASPVSPSASGCHLIHDGGPV